jgi:hypothetical protein
MIYLQVTFLQAYAASFLPRQILLKFNIVKRNTDGLKITIKFTKSQNKIIYTVVNVLNIYMIFTENNQHIQN